MIVFDFKYSLIEGLKRLDAEYYNPKYLDIVKSIRKLNSAKIQELFTIELGPAYASKKIGVKDGISISKIGDVTNKRKITEWELLDENEFLKFGSRRVGHNDILLTLTGDPPDVGKVNMPYTEFDDPNLEIAFNQRVAKLKSKYINQYYLYAALSVEYFRIRFEQCAFGIRQRNVSIPDLKSAYVFLADKNEQIEIGNLIREHFRLKKLSDSLYTLATQFLEQELGLDKISFGNQQGYIAKYNEIITNNRADADYFQSKYRILEEYIASINTLSLSSICNLQKGYEVGSSAYTDEGPLFIRVSNLTVDGFKTGNSDKYISRETYKKYKEFQPEIEDLLLTKDGTIGVCYVVDEEVEGVISSGIMKLKMKNSDIPKEYLALAINSKICQMQAERECSGALISHWKPEQIRKLRIPILDFDTMLKISDLVVDSKRAKKESQKLLEKAKSRVEELIEQSI